MPQMPATQESHDPPAELPVEDAMAAPMTIAPSPADSAARLDDLAQIIRSYTQVTDKLQRSHEALHDEVARLQRELSGANAQLQRSKRLAGLGEMAAGIAHEIRNPLAAIQLYADMLVEDLAALFEKPDGVHDVGPQLDTAEKIASAVAGLNAIVGDVLSFSREIKPNWGEIDVASLLDRAIESHRPAIAAAQVLVRRLDREAAPGDRIARVDAAMVVQALINLIRNAVDAMEQQGADQPRVLSLDVRRDGEQVVLLVRDSGPGIASVDIDRIFNPFFTTRSTGTGLGLAIVHRIIDAHGGTIGAFNDGGAVFEVRLPAVRPQALPEHVWEHPVHRERSERRGIVGAFVATDANEDVAADDKSAAEKLFSHV